MNALQLFAFVALPLAVAVGGWAVAFAVAPPSRAKSDTPSMAKHHQTRA